MKFVCSFAWADLEIRPAERAFIGGLIERLALHEEEQAMVRSWLEVPPPVELVDPMLVPREHRQIFLEEIKGVIESDGEISPEERESFEIFEALID